MAYVKDNLTEDDRLKVLVHLKEQGILPDQDGANWSAEKGHIETLKWLKEQGILPD
jgi:hypothetical protein